MRLPLSPLIIIALASGSTLAKKVGDICGTDSSKGVCEPTSWCNGRDGTVSQAGLCPGTPSDVRCCYYPKCSSPYQAGFCKPTWEVDVGTALVPMTTSAAIRALEMFIPVEL
ncbi:hypothetical protein V8F33_011372 [Rhypophila sp. PSN 637]